MARRRIRSSTPSDAAAEAAVSAADEPAPPRARRFRAALARWRLAATSNREFARWRGRWTRTIFLSLLVGLGTGLAVVGFEAIAGRALLEHILEGPLWLQILAPAAGLTIAAAALGTFGRGATPATADEYIRNFHERQRLSLRPIPGKIVASLATLGFGGAMGFEGPSIYMGAGIGDWIQRRTRQVFAREEAKVLMVAGAAAGVAAIFKTPATGAIFALEVPYQQDLASRAVVPALVASATSYVTFVAFYGASPLLTVSGQPIFDLRDLGGAAIIGLLAGLGARLFAAFLMRAKRISAQVPAPIRVTAAALCLGALAAASHSLFHETLALGPGYPAIQWAQDPSHTAALVLGLLLMRAVATGVTIGGGGAGGVFIPLVVEGALLGRFASTVVGSVTQRPLFTAVGAAAFLGAGYRTPIAAVMFVAESTGQPGLVVPGLIATALAQFLMGRVSVSPYQQAMRTGHLERRFTLPVSAALRPDVHTCPPGASLEEVLHVHFIRARAESIPVVEDGLYLGMVHLADVADFPRDQRATATARDAMRADDPVATLGWSLRQVSIAMERADIDRLAVVKADGTLAGIVTTAELVQLEEVLEGLGT